ncbi:MAG: class II aldolase/adducin family protein [Actinobacteria bacterium]|nr:class II aldolase/adducin family protein [Actinomycetota bacterium]MBU4240784.1 class II aldolase/adducin family protein [Actinomycetota bacterium]MBU4301929.1 class II aldolase/adducin family protein [Actinomycetota bacterium]MBU4489918.1 class II aldolase/adducin family protein [Actinomycetota bacterium]MCG2795808.1 class II aldolase/adducin family protein [Actinomycetes bacterium]
MESMVLEAMKDVLETAQEMARQGLVAGTSGNCSARVFDTDLVVITPTSLEYGLMLSEDMCVLNMDGEKVEGRYSPSIEVNMHLAVYRARPEVGGVVHTHQKMATAVAVAGRGIPPILEEQVFRIYGGIELAEYAPPGSLELADNAVAALGNRNACLLAHHGVVAVGEKLRDALLNAEIVERTATVYIMSHLIGGPRIVPFMEHD